MTEIPSEYRGWWRITETSQWVDDGIDILGPAVLSLTGYADRLRMHCLLAYVNCKPDIMARYSPEDLDDVRARGVSCDPGCVSSVTPWARMAERDTMAIGSLSVVGTWHRDCTHMTAYD